MLHARPLATLFLLACAGTAQAQTCGDWIQEQGQSLCVTGPVQVIATNGEVRTVLAADVNADDHTDILAVTPTAVYLRFGFAGGLGTAVRRFDGGDHTDMAVGLFNANGRLDLAITDRASDRVLVSYDIGDGNLAIDATFAVGDGPTRIRASDLDGDELTDLAVLNDDADSVERAARDGRRLRRRHELPGGRRERHRARRPGRRRPRRPRVRDGGGPWRADERTPQQRPRPAAARGAVGLRARAGRSRPNGARVDHHRRPRRRRHDGRGGGHEQSRIVAGLATGGGTVAQQTPYAYAWAWTHRRLRTVDWDRDGHTDIAAPHVFGPHYSVVWGNGNGTFGNLSAGYMYAVEHLTGLVTVPVRDVAFEDFDEDGHPDVAVGTGDSVVVQRGNP